MEAMIIRLITFIEHHSDLFDPLCTGYSTLPQAIVMLNSSISYHLISEGMSATDAVCD
jgi:hypothetical protein